MIKGDHQVVHVVEKGLAKVKGIYRVNDSRVPEQKGYRAAHTRNLRRILQITRRQAASEHWVVANAASATRLRDSF